MSFKWLTHFLLCEIILRCPQKNPRGQIKAASEGVVKRYVPAQQKRAALIKSDGKCAYPGCNRPSDLLHHRQRFHELWSHQSIVPLCKTHREFAHNGLIANEKADIQNWQLNIDEGVHTYSDAMSRDYIKELK